MTDPTIELLRKLVAVFEHGTTAKAARVIGRESLAAYDRAVGELADAPVQGPVRFGIVQDVVRTVP